MSVEGMTPTDTGSKTLASYLRKTIVVIRATSFEQRCLWERHSVAAVGSIQILDPFKRLEKIDRFIWRQEAGWSLMGVGGTLGLTFVRLNGKLVLFWEPIADKTDLTEVAAWFNRHLPTLAMRTSAGNFHTCFERVRAK